MSGPVVAAKLNSRVSIQRLVETPTGTGGTTVSWSDVAEVWADVRFVNGLEAIKSEFPVSIAKVSIRVRWRADVDATCRVVSGSTIFDVKAVLTDSHHRYVDLVCETGANNG